MIRFILGLPGSGKTYLANNLLAQSENADLLDDFSLRRSTDEKPQAPNLIITDVYAGLHTPDVIIQKLHVLLARDDDVEFIPFANDIDTCWHNVVCRDDGRLISRHFLQYLSEHYRPELFGEPIPVFRS